LTDRDDNELQELLRQQTVLGKFGELALKSNDLDQILTEACRLVGQALGTDLAKVVELQDDGDTLLVRAGIGWKPGVVGVVRLPVADGSSEGHAFRTGEAVVSADIDREDRFLYAPFLTDNGVRAIVNVLIIGADGRPPFGILQVDSREPRLFTDSDITFLRGYANLIAAAVDRLRAFESVHSSKENLERRVVERTRELTAANGRLEAANLRLLAEASERRRAEAALRQAQRMEALVEHLPMGAALVDATGRLLAANAEFRALMPNGRIPSADPATAASWFPGGRRAGLEEYVGARALRGEIVLNQECLRRDPVEGDRWFRVSGIPMRGEAGAITAALIVLMDVDEEKRAAERQDLLTRELDHRAKNMLAVVQAALRLTRADDMTGFVRAIEGRVAALARAQTLLARDRWAGADLRALLHGELAAFLDGGSDPRTELRGPVVALPPGAAQPLAMAIHELATNAIKYGSLSAPEGRLAITWRVEDRGGRTLRLRWSETGGPPVDGPPGRRGFGSRVLERPLRDQLGGSASMAWEGGLTCDIDLPLARGTSMEEAAAAGRSLPDGDARPDARDRPPAEA
jgi:two-component sensor histidine kinase/putative methionine-R-sulfoxide reductase with GAF domain